jgi:hypothetical protein
MGDSRQVLEGSNRPMDPIGRDLAQTQRELVGTGRKLARTQQVLRQTNRVVSKLASAGGLGSEIRRHDKWLASHEQGMRNTG